MTVDEFDIKNSFAAFGSKMFFLPIKASAAVTRETKVTGFFTTFAGMLTPKGGGASVTDLRSGLNNLFIFSKVREARSRLAGWLAGKPGYPQKLKVPAVSKPNIASK